MLDTRVPQPEERPGGGPPAGHFVGRDAEMDRLRAFRAGARTHGGALLVTGEPGIGKTELLHAAADAASEVGTRILRGAGIHFETAMSCSGLTRCCSRPSTHRRSFLPFIETRSTLRSASARARRPTGSSCRTRRRFGLDADLAGAPESIDAWTGAVVNR